jgi:competence protein ComEA
VESFPLPERPLPSRPISHTVRAWLQWFGLARLVVTAVAVLAVGAGAFWLLRAPATAVEQQLPMASRTSTTAAGTVTTTSVVAAVAQPGGTAAAADTSDATVPTVLLVHVAGAVARPGVVQLEAGARTEDAIAAAGGVAADADVDALNLAARLRDGDRLYVPHLGQPVPSVLAPTGGVDPGGSATPSAPAGPVDLNRATVDQLDALPGVGPATAAAIVAYRDAHGPFASVDDLLKVRGIGPAKLDAMRAQVAV